MLTVEEALHRCLALAPAPQVEERELRACRGLHLAAPLLAQADQPPWDNSAMDGYALRASEAGPAPSGLVDGCAPGAAVGGEARALRLVGEVAAGQHRAQALAEGECLRIFTGAPLPPGADAVIMQEQAERLGDGRVLLRGGARPGQHVRRAGEEWRAGEQLLPQGTRLGAAALGLCASAGHSRLRVYRPPRVVIFGTGDELRSPGESLGPGQIWASNNQLLCGLVEEAGAVAVDLGVAPDQPEALRQLLEQALEAEPDLILSSGGVSVGDRDLVKSLLGDGLDFWRVRVKPGKPLAAGRVRGRPMVGLPGNPVSAALNFLQFIRPGLRMALGDPTPYLPVVEARLQRGLRRAPGREELLRAQVWREGAGWAAEALGWQGSAHQRGLVGAEGLLLFARESNGAEAGDLLPVQLIAGQLPGSTEPGYRWGGRILA